MDLIEARECLNRWVAGTDLQIALPTAEYKPANLGSWLMLYRPKVWVYFKEEHPEAAAILEQPFEVEREEAGDD